VQSVTCFASFDEVRLRGAIFRQEGCCRFAICCAMLDTKGWPSPSRRCELVVGCGTHGAGAYGLLRTYARVCHLMSTSLVLAL
jgi:hypothetical protein